ncbi:MAG: rod shape-determining protein RodA [Lactobacillaceae bacterium]|jgi:rod shape determining protein RodA|nr:rod shape-determining protein RodA [Lactobacillaceae bacterium]
MQNSNLTNRAISVRRRSTEQRIDWWIVFTVIGFMIIGFVSLALSFYAQTGAVPIRTMVVQLVWWTIGWIAALILMRLDAESLYRISLWAYGVGIFLLVAVLFLYNRGLAASTGARSWFAFGGFTFQPSEVMKPAFILMLSKVIYDHNQKYPTHSLKTDWVLIGRLLLFTVPVLVLMLLQRDFGTMLVFVAIFVGMVFVGGISTRIVIPALLGFAFVAIATLFAVATVGGRSLLMRIGFQSYQFARIDSWLNPAGDTSADSYQLMQSIKAIGSGRLFGNGIFGMKVNVPVRSSDMIFSTIGEAFGFLGGVLVIVLFLFFFYLLIRRVFDTRNSFYAYVVTGVIMMIMFHVFENIGMTIGLLPLTGIPLPFISQGGSALLANMIGVGLTMSMTYHNVESSFATRKGGFQ